MWQRGKRSSKKTAVDAFPRLRRRHGLLDREQSETTMEGAADRSLSGSCWLWIGV